MSEKRGDRDFIGSALSGTKTKLLLLIDLKVPIVPSEDRSAATIRSLSRREAEAIAMPGEYIFLGVDDAESPIFACNLAPAQSANRTAELETLKPLVDLRSLALQGVLESAELLVAAQARSILHWHSVNRCCGRCGGQTHATDGGWRRRCRACTLDAYPRTDPAVIMLITRGERCLLGHEHRFPEKLYSTLAGFVEAGDDIEHAVRREIEEESGIEVGRVAYIASQPWPFPHSLMIGCWGEALTTDITIEQSELSDVRWFGLDEVKAMLAYAHPEQLILPPPISMAHTLLRAFVDGALPPTENF